jgi:hypothetical protein
LEQARGLLTAHPDRHPCLITRLPNFIFRAAGAVLLRRINQKAGQGRRSIKKPAGFSGGPR